MTDTPVFTVARNREMIQRAVERARDEERAKVAAALEVQANSIGGVIGAALREVAVQVTHGVQHIAPSLIGGWVPRAMRTSNALALAPI